MEERREFSRIVVPIEIEMFLEGQEPLTLETMDIGHDGAFIKAAPSQCPEVGTVVALKLKAKLGGEEPPTVQAKVMRTTRHGMGVHFIDA